jgi:hypothetical protein
VPTLIEIKTQFTDLVNFTVQSVKDGLSWDELLILQKKFTDSAMAIVAVGNLTGPERKAYVLEAVGMLFDALVGRVSLLVLPWYLAWILWFIAPAIRPLMRQVFIAAASSLIEQLFAEKFKVAFEAAKATAIRA